MKYKIMSHLVAHYPDRKASLEVARALVDGGCSYLEVQFPFSDPTADGTFIQEACSEALKSGFKVADGFSLIKQIKTFTKVPIFIMSYASLVHRRGVSNFVAEAKAAGAIGMIIPDLPFDSDEGLYEQGRRQGIDIVPVVAPSIKQERLKLIGESGINFLYAALRHGITGTYTQIGEENLEFINRATAYNIKVLAGFGICSVKQVEKIAGLVHAVIVGSEFIRQIQSSFNKGEHYQAVFTKMRELAGGN